MPMQDTSRAGTTAGTHPRVVPMHAAWTRAVDILPAYSSGARRMLLFWQQLWWNVRGHLHRTALDLARHLLHLGCNICGEVDLAGREANAFVLHSEEQRAAHEEIVNDTLNRRVGGDIYLLERAGDHGGIRALLVGVNADAVDALIACRLEHAQAAAAGNLEDDVGVVVADQGVGLVF